VRGVQRGLFVFRTLKESKGHEAQHLGEPGLALPPEALEIGLEPPVDTKPIHGDEHLSETSLCFGAAQKAPAKIADAEAKGVNHIR
jgi:hypothetical protein